MAAVIYKERSSELYSGVDKCTARRLWVLEVDALALQYVRDLDGTVPCPCFRATALRVRLSAVSMGFSIFQLVNVCTPSNGKHCQFIHLFILKDYLAY